MQIKTESLKLAELESITMKWWIAHKDDVFQDGDLFINVFQEEPPFIKIMMDNYRKECHQKWLADNNKKVA